eukprot:Opistho-1_new@6221
MSYEQYENEVNALRAIDQELQKHTNARQQMEVQLNENKLVLQEMKLLKDDAEVFRLMGPALVKQDLSEAKSSVERRLEYINSEIKRLDKLIKETEKKGEEGRDKVLRMQQTIAKQGAAQQAAKA